MRIRKPLILLLLLTASSASAGNRIRSADFPGKNEKITALKKYPRLHSEVKDAEFDIYDVNLDVGSSIPGATHRDYRVALSLKKEDAKKWLTGVVITSFPKDAVWCQALIAGKENFRLRHPKDVWTYTGKNKVAFYFEKDSVLCMRINQE